MSIVNVSNKEKTIKRMYQLLPSDNYIIDNFISYCIYENDNYQIELGNILDDYRDYFDQFLDTIELEKQFYYQPAAFAEYYYGTPDLDFLVLYFAKMSTLFEFKTPKITVLSREKMLEINRLMVKYKDSIKNSYNNPTKYIKEKYLKVYK